MRSLTLHLLGRFEARVNGAPLPRLRTRKGEWLLALLTLRAAPVDRAWLAGTLWPDSLEPLALRSLRTALADLRRALGPGAWRIHAPTPRTLALDLTGADVDVAAFDAAIARCDRISLEETVALYRGPLLEGCAEAWVLPDREALEQKQLAALEALAEEATTRGDHGPAEGYLRRAIAVDPLRETAHRGLMQVLAASGKHAAALEVYRELRLALHRELNAAPDPATVTLYEQIRGHAGAKATPTLTPRTRSHPTIPYNLPIPATPLFGRETEIARLCALLGEFTTETRRHGERHGEGLDETSVSFSVSPCLRGDDLPRARLVTLSGPPGTGKTRLALEVATCLSGDFADGIFFVSLAPIRDPALVASAIAQPSGVRETEERPLIESLKHFLQRKQILLVLDNFEQILPAAPLVAELLAAAPELKVLVTSRAVLRLQGERELPVPPLPVPDPQRLPPLSQLSQYAAVSLFAERARGARPDFALTATNARAVVEICHRLDGLPLAIELAAARVRLFSPEALLPRLRSRLTLLTEGMRDMPARHQTLRDAIAWSYDLLADEEQRLFRRLSVFVGGCTLDAMEGVCAEGEAPEAVLEAVTALVEQHLVRREETAEGEPRFTLLETLREFGQECLMASGEAAELQRRHAAYFVVGPGRPWQGRMTWSIRCQRMEREHENFRAVLAWAKEHREAPTGLRLAAELTSFWYRLGLLAEGREWLVTFLALPEGAAPSEDRAHALLNAGHLSRAQGNYDAARAYLQQSLAMFRELEIAWGIQRSLEDLGLTAMSQGHTAEARQLLEESLALSRQLGYTCQIADLFDALGGVLRREGDYTQAAEIYKASRSIHEQLGQREEHVGRELSNLGHVALLQGNTERAEALFRKSLRILTEEGFRPPIPGCIAGIAACASVQGRPERAARLLGAAESLAASMGVVWEADLDREFACHRSTVRASLGDEAFAAAWEAGRRLDLETAIEEALGTC